MASNTLRATDNPINIATPRPPSEWQSLPRKLQRMNWDKGDVYTSAMIQATYRGVRLEFHRSRDGRGRVAGSDPRFPKAWMPIEALARAIKAVPVPTPLLDPGFLDLWELAYQQADLGLEVTPSGRYLLRDDTGKVVKRAAHLKSIAEFLESQVQWTPWEDEEISIDSLWREVLEFSAFRRKAPHGSVA